MKRTDRNIDPGKEAIMKKTMGMNFGLNSEQSYDLMEEHSCFVVLSCKLGRFGPVC